MRFLTSVNPYLITFFVSLLNLHNPVYSICDIFLSANWLEREIFEMYGLIFYKHPNLRRLLTDYGFSGFPLLKIFPVFGFLALCFSYSKQALIYKPVKFVQKFREWDIIIPYKYK